MELAIHRLSVLLIDPTMTDQQFTEEVLFIKSFPIQSLFVLPYNIIRAKQLLAGSAIQIASFVDFPLGNGTVAKKSFETGQLYREGAANLFVSLSKRQIEEVHHETYQRLEQLSFGHHPMGLFLNTSQMHEKQKKDFASLLFGLNPTKLLLGNELTVEQALADMSIFSTAKRKHTKIQVNVKAPTLLELELLFQAGAAHIGISNGRKILSLTAEEDE